MESTTIHSAAFSVNKTKETSSCLSCRIEKFPNLASPFTVGICPIYLYDNMVPVMANAMRNTRARTLHSSSLTTSRVSPLRLEHSLVHIKGRVLQTCSRIQSTSQDDEQKRSDEGSSDRISQTLADLDALLGVEEEKETENSSDEGLVEQTEVGIAPSVIQAMAEAEAERAKNEEGLPKNVNDSIGRIVEQARKLSNENKETGTAGEEAMRKEFEQLLTVLTSPRGIDPEEIKELKEKVFGTQTFFVTEILPTAEFDQGILVRGNFRGKREEKFEEICNKIQELYGAVVMIYCLRTQ